MIDNIKIHFEQPEYIVNETNGVVICKLRFTTTAPLMVRWSKMDPIQENPTVTEQVVKTVVFAKNGDKFDANIGKKVALAKAENQAYSYVKNWMMLAHKEVVKTVRAMKDFKDKAEKVKNHNIEYMKKF